MSLAGANCSGVLAPTHLSFLTATVSLVLFLITVPGNFLVCLAVYRDPLHNLRTPFNLFVVNLAFADLVVGLLVEPTSVVIHLREGLNDGSLAGVEVIHLAYFISCTASLLSLAALTVDRYIAVTRPYFYRTRLNSTRAGGASVVIWVLSTAMPCILYFHVGYMKYAFVFANSAVILTLVILLVSYVQIYRRIHHQFSTSDQLYGGKSELSRQRRNAKKEARVTKAFLLVLVAFLMCYLPSCVMIYTMNLCLSCSCNAIHWLRDMQFLLVSLNSGLNPFLYSWRLPNFRTAFTIILRIRSSKRRSSSGPFMVVSGSSMGNNDGFPNTCAAAALSGLSAISAPINLHVNYMSITCQKYGNRQVQLTSGDNFMFQNITKEEPTPAKALEVHQRDTIRVEDNDPSICNRAHFRTTSDLGGQLGNITFSFRDKNIPRDNDHVQHACKARKSRGSYAEELKTNCGAANKSRQKFKQRRTSSAYATKSPARFNGRVLRSISLV